MNDTKHIKVVAEMYELESCPFCGGEAEVKTQDHWDATRGKTYYVICKACRCRTSDYLGWQGAVESWNRRAAEND